MAVVGMTTVDTACLLPTHIHSNSHTRFLKNGRRTWWCPSFPLEVTKKPSCPSQKLDTAVQNRSRINLGPAQYLTYVKKLTRQIIKMRTSFFRIFFIYIFLWRFRYEYQTISLRIHWNHAYNNLSHFYQDWNENAAFIWLLSFKWKMNLKTPPLSRDICCTRFINCRCSTT